VQKQIVLIFGSLRSASGSWLQYSPFDETTRRSASRRTVGKVSGAADQVSEGGVGHRLRETLHVGGDGEILGSVR
jgi:hypothetical protein